MASPQQKIVKVGDDIIAFPGDIEDAHVKKLIKSFREKRKQPKVTEESEKSRQLKPAQPLSSAIPSLPAWANTPIASGPDQPSVEAIAPDAAHEQAANARLQKAVQPAASWLAAHPKTKAAADVAQGVGQGIGEFASGMTSPANATLALGAPESKLLSAFFAVQAMRGSYRDAKSAEEAFKQGHNQEAIKYATQAGLGAATAGLAGAHAYKGLPEGVRSRLANEDGSVGPQEGGSERRANQELRKRIDEMTPDEMRKILKTSDVVDLPNKRSFQEDQHFSPMPFVARSDADGLKAFNDKFGYDKGDELLRAKAEALKEAGLNAYHEKGDEFLYRGKSDKELAGRLEKAREILRNKVFDVTLDDGVHVKLKGADFSYGTGKDLKEAEAQQHAHKQAREKAGERSRGELRGFTEVGPQADSQGEGAAQGGAAAPLAEIKKQAETLKPTSAYQAIDQSQPFYLKSENLINEKMKGPMAAEDVHKMLLSNGVKPEEMQWTGLDDLLKSKGKGKVTPQEVQEHLAGNNLQIKEVQKGDLQHGKELKEPWEIWKASDSGMPVYGAKRDNGLLATEATTGYDSHSLAKFLDQHMDTYSVHEGPLPQAEPPKYGSYTLPGGENYKEILLTMPSKALPAPKIEFSQVTSYKGEPVYVGKLQNGMPVAIHHNPGFPWRIDYPHGESDGGFPTAEAAKESVQNNQRYNPAPKSPDYQTNHWGEPNVLGHIRLNDRTGPNGEKILHLEELQSDWHQKGRTHRYVDPKKPYAVMGKPGNFATKEEAEASADESHTPRQFVMDERTAERPEGAVPDAPFKKTWPELMLKRMIKYASDHGYDGISWSPGDVQAERYDLSKQISRIEYQKVPTFHKDRQDTWVVNAFDHDGNGVLKQAATSEELPDIIGKEVAEKIVNSKENEGELSGLDLKVGGTGMKGFYDKIIPDAANKLGKQWGAKVGTVHFGEKFTPQDLEVVKQAHKFAAENGEAYSAWQEAKRETLAERGEPLTSEEREELIRDEIAAHDKWLKAKDAYNNFNVQNHGLLDRYFKSKSSQTDDIDVPYLPIKPQAKAGGKSVPYSLFGVAGAAVGLQAVKQKAEELQNKFREAGLSQ